MSLYTTPLQFGYFFSIMMAIIFWYRGYKDERLSDSLLGWVMLILALELQDYTFGFAGINFLWDEMNGFPRGVALLFGPAIYFYIKSQTNRKFEFKKLHLVHLLPWAVYFVVELSVFVQGKETVARFQSSQLSYWLSILNYVARLVSFSLYFYWSISIYLRYRKWSKNQFSNTEVISFHWFRNFIYLMIIWVLFREVMGIVDGALDLDFYQDWWWNLALAAFYVGIQGYGQRQPKYIAFEDKQPEKIEAQIVDTESSLAHNLKRIMEDDHLYLQSELNLTELA